MKLGLLNAPVLTADGEFRLTDLTLDRAHEIARTMPLDSAIGHESTAEIMTNLLGIEVPVHRQTFRQQIGQPVLVFALRERAPEGVILDRAGVEAIGYSFKLLERLA